MYRGLTIILMCVGVLAGGCGDWATGDARVERERSEHATHTELFLGYELGMAKQAFFDHSWALNKRGLVRQGPRNQTVQYELDDELPHPAKMYFYPDFHEDTVFRMRVRFQYNAWAPWNRHLWSDSLQAHVVDLFSEWYGEGFTEAKSKDDRLGADGRRVYVKRDGNRRIVVAQSSDSEVVALFTDMAVLRRIDSQ